MRRFFAFFILAAVLCGLTSGHAGASSPAPVVTDNAGDHNYEGNTARPVRSYLMAGNGSFMTRVEYTGDRTLEGTLVYGDMSSCTFRPNTIYNPLAVTA